MWKTHITFYISTNTSTLKILSYILTINTCSKIQSFGKIASKITEKKSKKSPIDFATTISVDKITDDTVSIFWLINISSDYEVDSMCKATCQWKNTDFCGHYGVIYAGTCTTGQL